jgi:hypothetical protein
LLLSVTALNVPRVADRVTAPPLEVRLLPLASFACTVIVEVAVPFAVTDVGLAVIVVVAADTGPATNCTSSASVIGAPAIVPVMTAVPADVLEVSVDVYVPLPLSVAGLTIVPLVVASDVECPPLVRLLPYASFAWIVIVVVEVPLAVIVDDDAEMVVMLFETAPGVNATVASSLIAFPPMVPVIVDVPTVVLDVSVAVYVPSP